jgi:hypothetical protein
MRLGNDSVRSRRGSDRSPQGQFNYAPAPPLRLTSIFNRLIF